MAPAPIKPWIAPRSVEAARPVLTVGTLNFGKRTTAAESERIVERALERGLVFFDTANAYVDGDSERILGRALRSRRDQVGIATKVGFGRVQGKSEGLSPARVLAALDESLGRLGTDYVDLYYLHVPDYTTPIEQTLDAVQQLLSAKKILHFGISNYASWQILAFMMSCDRRGIERPVASQVLYNLLIRQLDIEYFKFVREHPIHTSVYNALAGGGGRCVFAKCRFLAIVRGTMLRAEPCQSNTSLREHSLHGESHRTTPWDCAGGGVTTCLGRTADTPCTPTRIPSLDPTPLHHVTCGCRGCFRAPHT